MEWRTLGSIVRYHFFVGKSHHSVCKLSTRNDCDFGTHRLPARPGPGICRICFEKARELGMTASYADAYYTDTGTPPTPK